VVKQPVEQEQLEDQEPVVLVVVVETLEELVILHLCHLLKETLGVVVSMLETYLDQEVVVEQPLLVEMEHRLQEVLQERVHQIPLQIQM
tara:strand:- start:32 stop:298 length:267 start_codon:yes stop_codon:yes gene_type:complete